MSEWKEYKLEDIVTFQRGHDLPKSEMIEGEYPVAGSNGIIGHHNKFTTKGPGVTIGRSGNIGGQNYYESDYWAHNTVLYVKEFKKVEPKFFYYFLKTLDFSQFNAGSAVPTLNRNHIHELLITIPDIPEQLFIASILSSLDDKIDLLHRQNKTLEQLAETLFRQLFAEEADESCGIGSLSDEFDFTMGQSPEGSSLNENKIGTIFFQGRTDFGYRFPNPRVYTTTVTRMANRFDTLVSVRAPVGDMNMALEECCLGRGVAAFRYKLNHNFYSYTYYKMRSLMDQIKQYEDSGTVFGSIGKEDFKKLENIIPSQKMIEQFQAIAKPLDDKIFSNTIQIRILTQLRDTLLPKLMSGEVRVSL
jgi:type I restriction enzyme S subunit